MRKSRLSEYKQERSMERFVSGATGRTASRLCGANGKTAAYFFCRLHRIVAFEPEAESEGDESCFRGRRKGRRGRGAAGKVPVFGLLKRGGRVYTKIVPDASIVGDADCRAARRRPPDSIVYSDGWKGYNRLLKKRVRFRLLRCDSSRVSGRIGDGFIFALAAYNLMRMPKILATEAPA